MKCQKIINTVVTKAYNLCGYKTYKQNSETAIMLGKDLVDACKEQPLTEDLLVSSVKKYYPDLNIRIIMGAENLINYLRRGHWSEEVIQSQSKCGGIFFIPFSAQIGGTIFLNNFSYSTKLSKIKIFAHEFNHLEDWNYTTEVTKRKLTYFWKKSSLCKFLNKNRKYKYKKEEPKSVLVQKNIINLFGLKKMNEKQQRFVPNSVNTQEGFLDFYNSDKFTGLSSPKRIDAYIRALIRHEVNPKNKNSVKELKLVKERLNDEFRAYKTSEAVERYATGNYSDISLEGITVDLINRAIKIVNKEIIIARKESFLRMLGIRPKKFYKTGLPSTAVVE